MCCLSNQRGNKVSCKFKPFGFLKLVSEYFPFLIKSQAQSWIWFINNVTSWHYQSRWLVLVSVGKEWSVSVKDKDKFCFAIKMFFSRVQVRFFLSYLEALIYIILISELSCIKYTWITFRLRFQSSKALLCRWCLKRKWVGLTGSWVWLIFDLF